MKTGLILAFVVQTRRQDPPTLAWLEMPVGAEPFSVQATEDGIAVLALHNPQAPIIDHPIIVVPAGVPCELPIGFGFGAFIGHAALATGLAFVFRGAPWPKTVLEGRPTEGNA